MLDRVLAALYFRRSFEAYAAAEAEASRTLNWQCVSAASCAVALKRSREECYGQWQSKMVR